MSLALKEIKKEIEKSIHNEISNLGPSSILRDACGYALKQGGKRLRPIIVFLVARALASPSELIDAALAVEFFHTASLIADDLPCMDNEDERRGALSLHRAYSETLALLTSYALIAAGYERLQRYTKDPHRLSLVLTSAASNTGIMGATGGQFLDLYAKQLDESSLREIVQKKTSALFELSFVTGWLFGGGKIESLALVRKLASHFGLAFQIADDFSDVEQDAKKQRSINFPLILGKKRAAEILKQESQGFSETLSALSLSLPEFETIKEFLHAPLETVS